MVAASALPGLGSVLKDDATAPGSRSHLVQSCALPVPRMEPEFDTNYSPEFYKTKGRTIGSKFDKTNGLTVSRKDFTVERRGPCQILGKVSGTTEITITDYKARKTGSLAYPFFHYNGKFRSGDDATSYVEATILAFDESQKVDIEKLHGRLNLVSHPFIIRSLGYECGVGEHKEYILLALSRFEKTFAAYMEKTCKQTIELQRFTEEFIALIGCIVRALLKLHECGFYCPKLSARHIAIVKDNSKTKAMLLDFHILEKDNNNGKDGDWVRLGHILRRTAVNHDSLSPEINDLVQNLGNGTLKGMDTLKHSALLSVRKKFENILALSTCVLTHYKRTTRPPNDIPKIQLHCKAMDEVDISATEQLHCNSSDEAKEITFKNLLESDVGWTAYIPSWIKEKIVELNFSVPTKDTLREFVWQIRCLIEHEKHYLIETTRIISPMKLEFSGEKKDLESEIRKAWPFLFLNCQKFASSLVIKY